jgi:TPR repeat protein
VNAALLFEQACDGRIAEGCHNLAMSYRRGLGVPKDEMKAWELFARACHAGMGVDCGHKLGVAGGTL